MSGAAGEEERRTQRGGAGEELCPPGKKQKDGKLGEGNLGGQNKENYAKLRGRNPFFKHFSILLEVFTNFGQGNL